MTVSLKMQDCQYPTLDRLGAKIPEKLDAAAVMSQWFDAFAQNFQSANAQGISDLLLPDAFWRDILALTWDFRTFYAADILPFMKDRLASSKISNIAFTPNSAHFAQPHPDIAWVQGSFTFETALGMCSGIVRIVPTASGAWKGHNVFTHLEDLRGHPERIGANREPEPSHGMWLDRRRKEVECEDEDQQPAVVIIGAGQSGLTIAARLKYLGVKSLIIEREARVGHMWRTRYDAMTLHDLAHFDHLPYLPFPSTWPDYAPGPKVANWLEHYADDLELNVWTSTKVVSVNQDPKTHKWTVELDRNGSKRLFTVNHVVGAIGFFGNTPRVPEIPGKSDYQGETLHSTTFGSSKDYVGKRVAVIGSGNSAHDICSDLYQYGVDVTMIQRGPMGIMSAKNGLSSLLAPLYNEKSNIDFSDRIMASFPRWSNKEMNRRMVKTVAEADKDILDGLHKVGYQTHFGPDDNGPLFQIFMTGGGYYLDVGGCKLIAEGKVKLKTNGNIKRFTKTGLEFQDGSTLDADAIVYATGYDSVTNPYTGIVGSEVASKLKPAWGLDEEGEQHGIYRDSGVSGFWYMVGSFAYCRFHSKHLALQIKAIEEGLWNGERYSRNA